MPHQFNLDNLSPEQAKAVIQHLESRIDAMTASNNELLKRLEKPTSGPEPVPATVIRDNLAQWSLVMNEISAASDAEILRIMGQDSRPAASKMN